MIRLKHWLSVLLCGGTFSLAAPGQKPSTWVAKNDGEKEPPVSGVVDESRFFSRNSGTLERISHQLRRLEADHGYRIYLVVEPVLITTNTTKLASDLRQSWVPDGNGLVLVFESDSRHLGIGWDLTSRPDDPLGNASQVPSHETSAMLARARESTDGGLAPEPYLETLVTNLVREHEGYFSRRTAPAPPGRAVKMGLLIVGTLSLLGLGGIAAGALVRHTGVTAGRRFRFPVVDRPERLGAPCGGSVTARRFARPASKA